MMEKVVDVCLVEDHLFIISDLCDLPVFRHGINFAIINFQVAQQSAGCAGAMPAGRILAVRRYLSGSQIISIQPEDSGIVIK